MNRLFSLILGFSVLCINSHCSSNSSDDYELTPLSKPKPKSTIKQPINGLFEDHNARLMLGEILEFDGAEQHSYLQDVFEGQTVAEFPYLRASNVSWVVIDPDFKSVWFSYYEFRTVGILGHPGARWALEIDRRGEEVLIKGKSIGAFTKCTEGSNGSTDYCTFEFRGGYNQDLNGYNGSFTWQQFNQDGLCIRCTGTMDLLLE